MKSYTPETWRAASKKRRFHRRLNKVFLTIEDRLGNILEEEEPTEFDSESNDDEYEQNKLEGTPQLGLADGSARSDGSVKFFILVNSYPGGYVYSFRSILSGQLRGRKVMMMASQTRMI